MYVLVAREVQWGVCLPRNPDCKVVRGYNGHGFEVFFLVPNQVALDLERQIPDHQVVIEVGSSWVLRVICSN